MCSANMIVVRVIGTNRMSAMMKAIVVPRDRGRRVPTDPGPGRGKRPSVNEPRSGGRSRFRRWLARMMADPDELAANELRRWAASVPGTVRIRAARASRKVRIAGQVKSVIVRTDTPFPDCEAVVTDGTGEVHVLWLGRDSVPGVQLGSRLIIEGQLVRDEHGLRIVNPWFEAVSEPPA
jgi:hypothetical protein